MPTVGDRVKKLREKHGLTQKQLADVMGFKTYGSIQLIEYGKRTTDIKGLIKLANYFNVSLDYLVGRSDDPSPPNRKQVDEDLMQMFIEVENDPDLQRLLSLAIRLNTNHRNAVTRFIESFSE